MAEGIAVSKLNQVMVKEDGEAVGTDIRQKEMVCKGHGTLNHCR